MKLLVYFKLRRQCFAKPDGSLPQVMPMSSIEAANPAVHHIMMKALKVKENEEMDCYEEVACWGQYQHFTDKEILELGKWVSKHGIMYINHSLLRFNDHTYNISPFLINKWQDIEIFLGSWPIIPVPVLTTLTVYKSCIFPVSCIHSSSSPNILLHIFLHTWCPCTTKCKWSVSVLVFIEAAHSNKSWRGLLKHQVWFLKFLKYMQK